MIQILVYHKGDIFDVEKMVLW